MSTKPNSLRDAMHGIQNTPRLVQVPVPAASEVAQKPAATSLAPSRIGKRSVSGHFSPDVYRQLRVLAAESDRTVQAILEEALNDLFRKYDKSAIA